MAAGDGGLDIKFYNKYGHPFDLVDSINNGYAPEFGTFLARTYIDNCGIVSTVFIPMNQNMWTMNTEPPVLYETMFFPNDNFNFQVHERRATSEHGAFMEHINMVREIDQFYHGNFSFTGQVVYSEESH